MISLKQLWHKVTNRDPRLNDDGTMTTKHGNRIIPHKISARSNGGLSSNVAEYMFQPRVREIMGQVDHVNYSKAQSIILDTDTGDFYLKNMDESNDVIRARTPLGQIDTDLEDGIFRKALEMHKMQQLFGDCSHENPVVLDEKSGRVYAQNNPSKTRGFVNTGKTVDNPSPIK